MSTSAHGKGSKNKFLDDLEPILTPLETAILRTADVRFAEDLHSTLLVFSALASAGVRIPVLSARAAALASSSYTAVAAGFASGPAKLVEYGALAPANTPFGNGVMLPIPPAGSTTPSPVAPIIGGQAINHRLNNWPVRNQGARGTCVAFGLTACREHLSLGIDLSEQFLYWAIKDHFDPSPYHDGTWLSYAAQALQSDGVCTEVDWPYNNLAVVGHKGDPPPPPQALAAAVGKARPASHNKFGSAIAIYQALLQRPLAISLPVFGSSSSNLTNWTSPVSWADGRILNPPATAVAVSGHCVCVTGFEPDANEPAGGWFIIRNSWDTAWGYNGNPGNSLCPEPGYGSVSATYVDLYSWEWCQL